MAALCIGGVCIPYSAILPLCALGLKWVAMKLASLGLLPTAVAHRLGVSPSSTQTVDGEPKTVETKINGRPSLCYSEESEEDTSAMSKVSFVESVDEWREITSSDERIVVAQFTASWCGPCKRIEPFFQCLAHKYDGNFVKVDVDDLDEVAQECSVAMMPTFVVMKGSDCTLGRTTGTCKVGLEQLISEHCSAIART
eukprot:CAMPEP_0185727470 /NCGR_PEP_ID=MMETSP1171-20130828/3154_1 /TAXON_ID=374046 /ORGANISM="Helicotheca tamensis, Strain CCMP826" /LENGTH=196 /DNA_ID=CAMNT_0028396049 /DNA_START=76 /DNA_END=666 /DNA_ORIENTATION=-